MKPRQWRRVAHTNQSVVVREKFRKKVREETRENVVENVKKVREKVKERVRVKTQAADDTCRLQRVNFRSMEKAREDARWERRAVAKG